MVILDTSVISQLTKARPDAAISGWMERTSAEELYLSVLTLFELRVGIEMMDAGKRRQTLSRWMDVDLRREYQGRILPITPEIAQRAAVLVAELKRAGWNDLERDSLIAATAQVHGMEVATLNRKDFEWMKVRLVDF